MKKDFGICPFCKSDGVVYSDIELFGDEAIAHWECQKCNSYGSASASFELAFFTYNSAYDGENGDKIEIVEETK
jgi:hypothetical protein